MVCYVAEGKESGEDNLTVLQAGSPTELLTPANGWRDGQTKGAASGKPLRSLASRRTARYVC